MSGSSRQRTAAVPFFCPAVVPVVSRHKRHAFKASTLGASKTARSMGENDPATTYATPGALAPAPHYKLLLPLLWCALTLSEPPRKGRQGVSQSNRPLLQRRSQDSLDLRVVDILSCA